MVLDRPVIDGMRFVFKAFTDEPTRPWASCLAPDCNGSSSVQKTEDDAVAWCRFHVQQHKLPPVKMTLTFTVPALQAAAEHGALSAIARQHADAKLTPSPLPDPLKRKR
jgi:hypothetical protein